MKALEPELKSLKEKLNYLSQVNSKVKHAQQFTEKFVQEVVSVNEMLAKSLKQKKKQIRQLSRDQLLRNSESNMVLDRHRFGNISETENISPDTFASDIPNKISNSQNTSCDSDESELLRKPRFEGNPSSTFKKRACSTAMSNFKVFSFDEDQNAFKNRKLIETKTLRQKKKRMQEKRNSLGKL
jgi:hypothetical protein